MKLGAIRRLVKEKMDAVPNWLTDSLVGLIIGSALIYVAFLIAGWRWGAIVGAFFLYEGWAIVNQYPGDTLSESVWRFAKRPLVPWLFGLATAYGINAEFLTDPWLILGIGFLEGHFFFQKEEKDK